MKKTFVLVLTFVMLLTCASAFAETKTPPPYSSFATMKVTKNDRGYFFSLSKMVDRLVINWTDGLGPEELLVTEDLQASSIHLDRKFLAGIEQRVSDSMSKYVYEGSTLISSDIQVDPYTGTEIAAETKTYQKGQTLVYGDNTEYKIWAYQQKYPESKGYKYEIVEPKQVYVEQTNKFGSTELVPLTDDNGNFVYKDGEIKAYKISRSYNSATKTQTNIAVPSQTAFMTVQTIKGEKWAGYYNRSGQILHVEPFVGQF